MHMNLFKQAKLGGLLAAGVMAASVAHGATYNIGGFEVNMDTTLSVGSSWLVSDRRSGYLPQVNGGNPNLNISMDIANSNASCITTTPVYGGFCQEILGGTSVTFNHDGSINSDDGRLNFDQGDIISAPLKATVELETRSGNIAAFLRTTMYYDAALMNNGSFERGGLTDKGENNAGREFNVLDAFVTLDGDAGGMPYMVRVGRQVINWGENTFIPGGNSSFNPIDVAALRRPGAEIKDALLPVEAIYGSLAVTDNLTLEAYYGGWDEYKLDAGGTLFAPSDTFTLGTENGNGGRYFIGGGSYSGMQFACNTAALQAGLVGGDALSTGVSTAATISSVIQAAGFTPCVNSPNAELLNAWTPGKAEQERIASGEKGIAAGNNDDGDEAYGLAVRYYAENFNSTEFGLYYQVADSRLPYISYNSGKQEIIGASTTYRASTVGRGAAAAGLGALAATGKFYNPNYNNITVDDPYNLLSNATLLAAAQGVLGSVVSGYTMSSTDGTIARFQEINAGLILGQVNSSVQYAAPYDGAGQLPTGATFLGFNHGLSLFAEYPEIETWGVSFNTNIGGHTVQGDFNFRPDMPIQIDTDVLTISALFNGCAFTSVGFFEEAYQAQSTLGSERGHYNTLAPSTSGGTPAALAQGPDSAIGCRETSYIQGWQEEYDVSSWNIGTTSIFTSSNPFVEFVGADVGIFVTDFQGIVVPDFYEERGAFTVASAASGAARAPGTNHCIGGSDLPLNGILSIDSVLTSDNFPETAPGKCRSTDSSWGMTLLGSLQYNNAFGTPLTMTPQVVYQMGMDGRSPFPAGFWREGQGSAAFSLNVEYLGKWKGTIAYRDYLGDAHRNYNLDRNTVSASLSYAF